MTKTKAKRTRSIQVTMRLTPKEKAILDRDIKESRLSMNEYLRKTLINRVGLSVLNCERKYHGCSMEIMFKIGNQRIGYASCLSFENIRKVQVSGFYVIKQFQNVGIEEKLLEEIYDYAAMNKAESIVVYPGAEPYCPTEWKPIEVQTAWYEKQGFRLDHKINGVAPCMVKVLDKEVAT